MATAVPQPRARTARTMQPRPAARTKPPRKTAQRRLAGGIVWIAVVAALLAGVVALNVAVLRVNMQLDELGQKRAKLRADNAALSLKLASAAATARIEKLAAEQLGARPASEPVYVTLPR